MEKKEDKTDSTNNNNNNNYGEEDNNQEKVERTTKKKKKKKNNEKESSGNNNVVDVPLMALNHVSRLCSNVKESIDFYRNVLGFVLIERPEAFDFDGAWLFNYGVGIHLIQNPSNNNNHQNQMDNKDHDLDPMDNHISFQCEDMEAMEEKLKEKKIKYIKRTVGEEEDGAIDQLFFNDPDGFMVEICNCENVKLVPQRSIGRIKLPFDRHNPPLDLDV